MNFFMYIFSLQILITTSGFYLGFIIWGRSPEWPKATSLLKGSPPPPPGGGLYIGLYKTPNKTLSCLVLSCLLRQF